MTHCVMRSVLAEAPTARPLCPVGASREPPAVCIPVPYLSHIHRTERWPCAAEPDAHGPTA
eukprot:3656224-Prymnesium_polylepis.1